MAKSWKILIGDCLEQMKTLEDESVHMIWTSPPYYGLRDYGDEGQIGLEPTPQEYVEVLVRVFREAKRVLRKDGTLWLNLGDSYSRTGKGNTARRESLSGGRQSSNKGAVSDIRGTSSQYHYKPKDLMGIPWRAAFALQKDGWYLRSDIIWAKGISGQDDIAQRVFESAIKNGVEPEKASRIIKDLNIYTGNSMPESVRDRPSSAHEHLFLFSKSEKYYYDYIESRELSVSDKPSGNGFKRQARLSYRNEKGIRGNEEKWEVSPKRNLRNVWCIPTKPFRGAHFATAPENLLEPCVRIGTSEYGSCAECGSPYEREVERKGGGIKNEGTGENLQGDRKGENPLDYDRLKIKGAGGIKVQEIVTTGWKPTCKCDTEEVVPCVVLDPFMGAATTLLVADRLGRDSIGIELNSEYVKIAEKRLEESRREIYAPWHDKYIPIKTKDEIPSEMRIEDFLGKERK